MSEEREQVPAVPLCLPNNFLQGEHGELEHDQFSSRDDIVECEEGLKLLERLEEPLIVICITGPARSGKSFFLSQLQEGVKFSLGHSATSHTIGIWIAVCPKTVMREGKDCRIVLLDAEGTNAISSVDDEASPEWDTKVFTLCILISSVLIYNTTMPTRNDLQQLGFIAKFSDSICKNSKGNVDKEVRTQFKRYAPRFIWLIRDTLVQIPTKTDAGSDSSSDSDEEDAVADWNHFIKKKVLCKKKGSDNKENEVVSAIKHTFSSIQAFGIPTPTTKYKICRKLDDPSVAHKIQPFLSKIKEVASKVMENAEIKKMQGDWVTGTKLARLIRLYIKAINSETKSLPWENMWDTATKAHLQQVLDARIEEYANTQQNLEIPCPTSNLEKSHSEAHAAALEKFQEFTSGTDQNVKHEYIERLKLLIEKEYQSKKDLNDQKSKDYCRNVIEELRQKHHDPLKKNEEQTYRMFLQAKEKIAVEYNEQTVGYAFSQSISKENDKSISEEISLYAVKIINNAEIKAISEYDKMCEKTTTEPRTEHALETEHVNLVAKVEDLFKSYVDGHSQISKLCADLGEKLNARLADRKTKNQHSNSRQCDREIEKLKTKYWYPKMNSFPHVSFQELTEAKDNIIRDLKSKFDSMPNVEGQIGNLETFLNQQLNRSVNPIVKRAMRESVRKYSDDFKWLEDREPCVEESELLECSKKAENACMEKFDILVNGCDTKDCNVKHYRDKLEKKMRDKFKLVKVSNENKSDNFNQTKMKNLIQVYLQKQFTAGSLTADTNTARSKIFEQYDVQAFGPTKDKIKTHYTSVVDAEINKIQFAVSSNRLQTTIHVLGTVAGMVAGGMSAIGPKVSHSAFHVVKGVAHSASIAAEPLAKKFGSIYSSQPVGDGSSVDAVTSAGVESSQSESESFQSESESESFQSESESESHHPSPESLSKF